MFSIIASTGDKPLYVKLEEHNIILVKRIEDCSKFTRFSDAVSCVLKRTREAFPEKKFAVGYADSNLFGAKPRNIVNEEAILNDTYFHSYLD